MRKELTEKPKLPSAKGLGAMLPEIAAPGEEAGLVMRKDDDIPCVAGLDIGRAVVD